MSWPQSDQDESLFLGKFSPKAPAKLYALAAYSARSPKRKRSPLQLLSERLLGSKPSAQRFSRRVRERLPAGQMRLRRRLNGQGTVFVQLYKYASRFEERRVLCQHGRGVVLPIHRDVVWLGSRVGRHPHKCICLGRAANRTGLKTQTNLGGPLTL